MPLDQTFLVTILLALISVLFAVVVAMLGWMGNKLYNRLTEMASTMHGIESGLHGRITELDRRVTRVESRQPRPLAAVPMDPNYCGVPSHV